MQKKVINIIVNLFIASVVAWLWYRGRTAIAIGEITYVILIGIDRIVDRLDKRTISPIVMKH